VVVTHDVFHLAEGSPQAMRVMRPVSVFRSSATSDDRDSGFAQTASCT
jgi:hypothetical protein